MAIANKKTLYLAFLIAVLGTVSCGRKGETHAELPKGNTVSVPAITAEWTRTPLCHEATGTVRSEFEASLSAKVMGRISRIDVKEGDSVHKGQVLVYLEASDLNAAVDLAAAGVKASNVSFDNAKTVAEMEESTSKARIAQAKAALAQAEAALGAAKAKLDLAVSGPRTQERTQAALGVRQAEANLKLAKADYDRMLSLYTQNAISRRQLELAEAQYDVARAQYDTAVQAKSIADEGSREEDIRAAREGVRQAQAAYATAKAGLAQAEAAAMQAKVRLKEIKAAQAQVNQSRASLRLAQVNRSYSQIVAPFDGIVSARMADPGATALPGVPLLSVEGGKLRLEAIVPESIIKDIFKGQKIDVNLDALPGTTLVATISEIRPQGDQSTHTFLVRADIPRGKGALSGMFGRAKFPRGTSKQIMLPIKSTWQQDGLDYVYTVSDKGRVELRLVTLGDRNGSSVAVLSGLKPGEKVLLNGRQGVREGDTVQGGF